MAYTMCIYLYLSTTGTYRYIHLDIYFHELGREIGWSMLKAVNINEIRGKFNSLRTS